jgi:MFS family permease
VTSTLRHQPRAVYAVAFACVVAFMGIGLVDPILPTLADQLDASPSDVSLLFTSYFAMTGVSMLVTGWLASRIGPRPTLLVGLALVVVFSALAGAAGSVFEIAGFRLGWGLGNALFIATALSVIVGAASGGLTSAIILYEAALGLGIASGPLLGGLLGGISWRGPFFGTAVLMAIGFVLIVTLLGPVPKPERRVSLLDPLRALGHGGLRAMAIVAVLYNFGFFTILAYTPFLLGLSAHQLGIVYFGWGLLVAITSVFVAQRMERRYGLVAVLAVALGGVSLDLLAGGVLHASVAGLIVVVVVSGGLLGIVNTVLTEAVMAAAVVERPVASSAYSFVRFTGGAIAPWVAGKLGEHVSAPAPMYLGAGMVALSVVALVLSRGHLRHGVPAAPATDLVLVTIDGTPAARGVVETAARVARSRGAGVHVLHIGGDARAARTLVDAAVGTLRRAGVAAAGGEVVRVTGDHAGAVLDAAERRSPTALVVGRGDPSVAAVLSERSPCDVIVVVEAGRLREPVAA